MKHHQFNLFPYAPPTLKIPMRRITLNMYREARRKMQEGDDREYLALLMDLNDSLDRVLNRMK